MLTDGIEMTSRHRCGLSLVECLVTLAVAAILAAAAYPALHAVVAEQTVTHAADRLAASLALGRSIAATQLTDTALLPLAGHAAFDHGWQIVSRAHPDAPLLAVPLPDRCLRIALRGSRHESRRETHNAGHGAHAPGIRWTAVGYSRSEHGGFHAATFVVRCHGARRQVRLGAQGRIRICQPPAGLHRHADRDCD